VLFTHGVNGGRCATLFASVVISENQWFNCVYPIQGKKNPGRTCVHPGRISTSEGLA
jgi:hypothetical protein